MVQNDEDTGLISYVGKKHTLIKYDQNLYQWNISVVNDPSIQGVSYSEVSSLVIGRHSWHITGDYACSSKDIVVDLSLSSCKNDEFTCTDGVCIDMIKRCDNINHCKDKSDEADCGRVKMSTTYQKFIVPPPHTSEEEATNIDVGMKILNILDISEVNGFFQVQFHLSLKWFDSRLRFRNLKNDIDLNNFLPSETADIWVPELIFENTEEKPSTVVDESTTIKLYKMGNFKPSVLSENENIQYFEGSENQILMIRFYNQKFICNYMMGWYPFDVQRCQMTFSMKKAFAPFTNMQVDKIFYEGEKFMTKYEVKNISMKIEEIDNIQVVQVEITLGRQLLSVMLNVFVPTLVLNIISYSTNFYKECYFESVIGINLTSMLVLVALFVSVRILDSVTRILNISLTSRSIKVYQPPRISR